MNAQRYFGKYSGIVENNEDPEGRGRVRVCVPALLGSQTLSWAMPCVPFAGPGVGFFMIPPKGAGVWVEFEGGDIGRPIWTGCFWGPGDLETDDAHPDVKFLRTDRVLVQVDDSGSGEMIVEVDAGGSLRIGRSEIVLRGVTIRDETSSES